VTSLDTEEVLMQAGQEVKSSSPGAGGHAALNAEVSRPARKVSEKVRAFLQIV